MKLAKKVLVTDIDGTLVTSKKIVTDRVKKTIREFQNNGGIVVIASGRQIFGMMDVVNQLELNKNGGYIMSSNGSLVTNAVTNEVLFERKMSSEIMGKFREIARKYGISILTYEGNTIITEDSSDYYFQIERSANKLGLKIVDDIVKYVDFDIYKIMATGEPEVLKKLEVELKEKIRGYNIFRSEPFFLEINPLGISKGEVLPEILLRLGCTVDDVMAIGDGYNDITMLQVASLGVAMANANDEVIDCANAVTLSNDEDGLAIAMEKYIFID